MTSADSLLSQEELADILEEARLSARGGEVADYIPELRVALRGKIGITVHRPDGPGLRAGDTSRAVRGPGGAISDKNREKDDCFSIQSISKVFSLLYVLEQLGEKDVFKRVGKEPTGDPFNADPRVQSKGDIRMPYNPMINVGAIFITSLFPGDGKDDRFNRFFEFLRRLCGDAEMLVEEAIYCSEKRTGHNNRSLAWQMNADGIFLDPTRSRGEVNEEAPPHDVEFIEGVLDNYFRQCSILVTCDHLARAACVLAMGGLDPDTGERLVDGKNVRTVVSLMSTCGLYDGSGEFAYDIGIPGKSGVGGGIMGVVPGRFGVATFSPALDGQGNSVRGLYMLKQLSRRWKLHVFFREPEPDFKLCQFGTSEAADELAAEIKYSDMPGRYGTASYIPELGNANALDTGIALCNTRGEMVVGGDYAVRHTLQSISNVFGLLFVLNRKAEGAVFRHVGKEPSGEPFHVLKWKQFEEEETKRLIPFNPMINAGAIVLASMIPPAYEERIGPEKVPDMGGFLPFVRTLCGNPDIQIDTDIFESERSTGFNNRSLAWLMNDKDVFGPILHRQRGGVDNELIEDILSVYFRICSITVDCRDLARCAAVLANGGHDLDSGKSLIPPRHCTIAISMMALTGLYEGSGEFASEVGIPAKTGVSGGMLGVVPGKLGIATYGPVIDDKGNSFRGQQLFSRIEQAEALSVFSGGSGSAADEVPQIRLVDQEPLGTFGDGT